MNNKNWLVFGGVLVCAALWASTGVAQEAPEMETVTLPAADGFALSFDVPKDWTRRELTLPQKGELQLNQDGPPWKWVPVTQAGLAVYPGRSTVQYNAVIFPDDMDRENFVARLKKDYDPSIYTFFDEGDNDLLGPQTYYRYLAQKTYYHWQDGKNLESTSPLQAQYLAFYDKRLKLEINFIAPDPEEYARNFPAFKETLKHLKVERVDASDTSRRRSYSSPTVQLSQRDDYFLEGSLALALPPGWKATEKTLEAASASSQNGKIAVEVHPGEDEGPKLLIMVEGIGMGVAPEDFFQVGDRYVASLLPEHKNISVEDATDQVEANRRILTNDRIGHCLSKRQWGRGRGTGQVRATTYTGKSPAGKKMKMRLYSAGGTSLACNYIYTAPAENFDAFLPDIEEILGSLSLNLYSPSFAPR